MGFYTIQNVSKQLYGHEYTSTLSEETKAMKTFPKNSAQEILIWERIKTQQEDLILS